MDKNIPQFIVEKIENKAKKHGNQYESKYNAYVDFKRGAEFGYLLAQSENDNMAVEFVEWKDANYTSWSMGKYIIKGDTNYPFHSLYSISELFTQFKKSKQSNV